MKLFNVVLLFVAGFVLLSSATAQVPATTAPAKIGLINSASFSNPTGGITRLVTTLRTIETEFKPKQDEITRLIAQLETLGRTPAGTPAQIATRREQAQALQIEIRRKQEDARGNYAKRFSALTDPIYKSIFDALQAYAKQRGLDALVDINKFPDGFLLLNASADLTPAFIRDYNSRNP